MEGKGSVAIYGASRALDVQDLEHLEEEQNGLNRFQSPGQAVVLPYDREIEQSRPLNVFLLGVAETGTMVKTLARARRHPKRHINFYVSEPQTSLLARHILLLYVACSDDLAHLSYKERAELYLELYGCLFLRQKTHEWLRSKINDLIRIVTDAQDTLGALMIFNALRFRERDDIEFVFKFWKSTSVFQLDKLWDFRLKRFYRTQYDSRENAVDWDYHMKLRDNSKYIHKSEFLAWRLTGIAFDQRDAPHTFPNRTLATVDAVRDPTEGITATKWGYFGDVATGPWVAWGTDSENKDLLKTANDQPTHTAAEIAQHNVQASLAELRTGRPDRMDGAAIALPSFSVHFLPCDPARALAKLAAVPVDVAVIGMSLAHRAPDVVPLLDRNKGTLLVETAKWVMDLNKDHKGTYLEKIVDMVQVAATTHAAPVHLHKRHQRKVWEASGKWVKVGSQWDYLMFTTGESAPAGGSENALAAAVAALDLDAEMNGQ
ncbi:hypothetical protein AMAG_07739 [Allomyces macrogynus ATCC 38327]|uniref:Dynein assembly factor 3, axonemal n=1 Tax=Allomyces macrogynus (strain ATCC 38327) TaxID=578462 RepID=A0A0L0SJ70_ALLM3|nr:hypothetical protein AMAG_07739 [Allomyces macrogynus ATCC 38327]|eukprot:KNE62527.1 hypothetical protein AMAG_07739 [Allomyces macrogynus ATCC 38327]